MRSRFQLRSRQKGAVAIVFGLSAITLFAMGGVVLDLGHLYVAKSELQNAADAAALGGAKELKETAAGITLAVSQAQAIALKNKYNFSTDVVLAAADIEFGPGPDGPWSTVAAATAAPAGKTFIKVNTGLKSMDTYLMRVMTTATANFDTVSTLGVAVAGRYVNDITPIGVCAVDPVNRTAKYAYPTTGLTELVEFGFRRGVTYDVFGLNPLGGSSVPYLINPVATPATGCNPANSSASFTATFLCNGTSAVISSGVGQVYTNTGVSASTAAQLNSRFDDFSGPSQCIPAQAPPDTNIKEYPCKKPGSSPCVTDNTVPPATPLALPRNWMEMGGTGNLPNQQSVKLVSRKPAYQRPAVSPTKPALTAADAQFAGPLSEYGVLWSYGPAYQADSSTPPDVGAPITPGQANLNPMYSTAVPAVSYFDTTSPTLNYPATAGTGFPVGTPPAPYNQTSGIYFRAPSVAHPGVRNRRILNLVLVDCRVAPVGPSSCGLINAVGIGKFFMQTKADFSGSPKKLEVEFAGLIEPIPVSEIKLYR